MLDWDDGKHKKVKRVRITYGDDFVNSIQVEYYDDGDKTVQGPWHGDKSGKYFAEFTLEPQEYIIDFVCYYVDEYVSAVLFRKPDGKGFGPYGRTSQRYLVKYVPEGNHVVGLRGKSDNNKLLELDAYVDPINLSGGKAKATRKYDWDDGAHDSVKKVHVTFDDFSFKSIQFELYGSEYLTQWTSYFDANVLVCGMKFMSNQRSMGPYGKVTAFEVETRIPEGYQITGFGGNSVHPFTRVAHYAGPKKLSDSVGVRKGQEWDDGANHDGVRKIVVGIGQRGIHYIKFSYEISEIPNDAPIHGLPDETFSPPPFEIDHPNEYLVSIAGSYDVGVIQGLHITNKRESQFFGYADGTKFTLEVKDKKIVGFHGFADTTLNFLGAYFVPISSSSSNKVDVQGGKGGKEWDVGADHNGVRKIVVRVGRKGVHYINFDYDKNGQLKDGTVRGLTNGTFSPPPTFEIDHPDEYLVSIVGYYDDDIIQGLQFKTNKRESQVFGYGKNTKFTLEVKDKRIVGFYGYSKTYFNSLGAYFAPISNSLPSSISKLEAHGGKGETTFDDGTFDNVRRVYVGQGDSSVIYVKFEYEKGGKVETFGHGKRGMLGTEEFELEKDEYITSVEGYYDKIYGHKEEVIAALIFKTSKGRTSPQFGVSGGEKFVLDGKGGKLVGFHGSVGEVLHSLGPYFAPSTTPLILPNK